MEDKWRQLLHGDRMALAVLAVLSVMVILWTALALCPSSYGLVLTVIQAQDTGLIAGQPQAIRSDEWAVWTPYFQATVRNHFERINRSSFYSEDLRNVNALPLRDWGLIFKPQLWAFFVLPPANAYAFYFAVLMAAFLAGYFFLFRELGFQSELALVATVLLFASGLTQFWWTTLGPVLSLAPWVALIFLRRYAWYVRFPLFAYGIAVWVIAHPYPVGVTSTGITLAVLVLALRRETLRSVVSVTAAACGLALALGLVYWYFADQIPLMMHSAYPGHRREPPGGATLGMVLAQFWPALNFSSHFRNLEGPNLCEMAVAGSFLPALTLCSLKYALLRSFFSDAGFRPTRQALAILGSMFALATWWVAGSCPGWIGHLFFWDQGTVGRQSFLLGTLLLTATLLMWKQGMVIITPWRAAAFVLLGPVAATVAKRMLFGVPLREMALEAVCIALAASAALVTIQLTRTQAAAVMLATVVLLNGIIFLRFNPLQSAYAIFAAPDSPVLEKLQAMQAETPGSYLAIAGYPGSVLNGLGLRSATHTLIAPKLEFFRPYFPTMRKDQFESVFNRYANVQLQEVASPYNPERDVIVIPLEVFRPVQNNRKVLIENGAPQCGGKTGGEVGTANQTAADLVLTGWAPWSGESEQQSLHIWTKRPVTLQSIVTVTRPDIADSHNNYSLVKAGFLVALSAQDHQALTLNDLHIAAESTLDGQTALYGCPQR